MFVVPETLYDPARYPDSGATNLLTPESGNLMGKAQLNGDSRINMANGDKTPSTLW